MIDVHEVSVNHIKLFLIAVGMLLLSIYFSATEIRYLVSGEDREVAVIDTYEFVRKNRYSESVRKGVRFILPDGDQGSQMVALEFANSWMLPADGKLWVTWIPRSSPVRVRLRGEQELAWLLILLGAFVFIGIKTRQLWREACADADGEHRSRQRARRA
jgi:hypothetical protein